MFRSILTVLRPHQWTKNLLLFAALIFAGDLGDRALLLLAVQGFFVFCLLSSATYVLNDIADRDRDRMHPRKRTRPIASGALPVPPALAIAIVLGGVGLLWAFRIHASFAWMAVGYFVLILLYSVALKALVLVDVMVIAIGFVLRAVASVHVLRPAAPETDLSPWLLVCTFFLALFLALAKRRNEVAVLGSSAEEHRATLTEYPQSLVDALIAIVTGSTAVSYAIYTIWPGTVEKVGSAGLVYTVPFVVYGLMRYLYLMFTGGRGGQPSRVLLTDLPLAINILLWVLTVLAVLYAA